MRRAVEKHLEDPFAEHLLRGDIKEGDVVKITKREGEKTLKFSIDEPAAPPEPEPPAEEAATASSDAS